MAHKRMLEFDHYRPGLCPLEISVESVTGIPWELCPLVPLDPAVHAARGCSGAGGVPSTPALKPVAEVRAVLEFAWERDAAAGATRGTQTLSSNATFLDDERAVWRESECTLLTFATPGGSSCSASAAEEGAAAAAVLSVPRCSLRVKLSVQPPGYHAAPAVDAVVMSARADELAAVVAAAPCPRAALVEGASVDTLHPASHVLRCAALDGSAQTAQLRVRRCDTERVHVSWSGGHGVEVS